MTSVAVGCPVRNRAWVLPRYVAALPAEASRLFVLNGDEEDQAECRRLLAPAEFIAVDPPDGPYYARLAALRNIFVQAALAKGVDYLFSVDSDIILPPGALEALMRHDLPAVAALVNNVDGGAIEPRRKWWPNAGRYDDAGYVARADIDPWTGLHKVQVSGAAVLLRRDALERILYAPNAFGEDIPASLSLGGLWLDSNVVCEHAMIAPSGRHER